MSEQTTMVMPSCFVDMDATELTYDGEGSCFSDLMKALGVIAVVIGVVGMMQTPWSGIGQAVGAGMILTGNLVD